MGEDPASSCSRGRAPAQRGTNGATKGLAKKYPGRVLGTPTARTLFAGLGGGLALDGRFRPGRRVHVPDFLWVAADQVFNQIGKARPMFGGRNPVRSCCARRSPWVRLRVPDLMDPAGIFATSPGWRIMPPRPPYDYVGLMNAALAIEDTVLMLEHVDLYASEGEMPAVDLDYQIPFGRPRCGARATTSRAHVLSMVEHARRRSSRPGVDAELIDLPFLDGPAWTGTRLARASKKTNACSSSSRARRAPPTVAGSPTRSAPLLRLLDQPVQRVTGSEASPSISKVLERAAIARTEEVASGLDGCGRASGGPADGVGHPHAGVLAGATEAAIATWLVAPGDTVSVGDPLAEIETEKAIVEYSARRPGSSPDPARRGSCGEIGAPIGC